MFPRRPQRPALLHTGRGRAPAQMQLATHTRGRWGPRETLFVLWIALGALALIAVTSLLAGSFTPFTLVWLAVPLFAVLRSRDAARVGFRAVPWRACLRTATIALAAQLVLMALFEPWSHAYAALVQAALASATPDPTFAWLIRLPGLPGYTGMALYSGLVTIFAEELFFRGWLLQLLQRRLGSRQSVILQAMLFVLPQGLAALLLAPLQGIVFAGIYTFVVIGLIGGWAAARTGSIWPSLLAATLCNLIVTAFVSGL
jgi:membrane protease YdiL (CAAX protease family)